MDNNFYIGPCPVCQGMLEIIVGENHNFSVLCDDCSAEWNNPEDALNVINGFRQTFSGEIFRSAAIEEIIEIGWEKYLIDYHD